MLIPPVRRDDDGDVVASTGSKCAIDEDATGEGLGNYTVTKPGSFDDAGATMYWAHSSCDEQFFEGEQTFLQIYSSCAKPQNAVLVSARDGENRVKGHSFKKDNGVVTDGGTVAVETGEYRLATPIDVTLSNDTVLQPDLLVARRADFAPRDLPVVPLLAVEVLSPSTKRVDLALKRARYEAAGCPSYWVVDPDLPAITAGQRRDGEYVEAAGAAAGQEFAATEPYPFRIDPARLLG